jgi:hypothetical protein
MFHMTDRRSASLHLAGFVPVVADTSCEKNIDLHCGHFRAYGPALARQIAQMSGMTPMKVI